MTDRPFLLSHPAAAAAVPFSWLKAKKILKLKIINASFYHFCRASGCAMMMMSPVIAYRSC
jgi:hypothetical protein